MSDSKKPKRPNPRTWLPPEPPPRRPPDAVIVPEGQLAEVLPDGLLEALQEEGPSVALDPRWKAARDAFLASMDKEWGGLILKELLKVIESQKDGAKESAKDLRQKVLLVASRQFEHFAKTGKAWEPDNPAAYFRTVARNVAMNHFTVKARKPAIERGVEVDEILSLGLDPEEATRHGEFLEAFEREGGTLTAEEAEVFKGRMVHRMTFDAIAAVVGRSKSTVHDQYDRALAKLNAIVERAW